MYLSNISELWFSFGDTLISCLTGFIFAMLGITLLGALLCFWKIPFYCYILFTWGLGFALYIQGNLVPMKAGILNGAGVNWNAYQKEAQFSVVLWLACIILPFFLVRLFPKRWEKIIRNCSLALLALQLVTVILLCVTTDFSNARKADYFLSEDGIYNIGKEKNVVCFVLDTYDQQYFEKACEQEPELRNFLDGFTYFTNATNVYPCTAPSIRYLLTNQFYLNDRTLTDWVEEGWASSSEYYQALRNSGFDISVYTPEDGAVSEEAKTSFIKNVKRQRLKVASHTGLAQSLLRLTAIRYFPDALKQYVWVSDYTSLFDPLKEVEQDAWVYDWEDEAFYQGLIGQGLALAENNQFHFIHLRGVHMPNSLLADLTVAENSRDAVTATEAIACLKILREYCNQLKELGVYDDTCIIITADHGDYDRSMATPIFLVKGFDSRGAMSISDVPVSHQNLMATVADELSLQDAEQYGISVFDVTKENTEPRRYFRHNLFGDHETGYLPTMVEYTVRPEDNLPEDFVYTGKVYALDGMYETIPYQYIVGEPIQFQDAEDLQYFISGIPVYIEKSGSIWIKARKGKLRFAIDDEGNDLICTLSIDPYMPAGQQRFIVTHEGEELYHKVVLPGTTEISFTVPNHCVLDGVLELDFQCPDGLSRRDLGIGDDTETFLSFPLHQILFTRAAK